MKIVGKDGKEYATVEEAQQADELYEQSVEKEEAEKKAKKADEKARKKERIAEIDEAKEQRKSCWEAYANAVQEATSITSEAEKQAKAITDDANKKANAIRSEAYQKFAEADDKVEELKDKFAVDFGEYVEVTTGADAVKRTERRIRRPARTYTLFDWLFNPFI